MTSRLRKRTSLAVHSVSQCKNVDFNGEKDQVLVVVNSLFFIIKWPF